MMQGFELERAFKGVAPEGRGGDVSVKHVKRRLPLDN